MSLLFKNVMGEGGAHSRGRLFVFLAQRVGAYSGKGAYQSVDAYSRKYVI